MPNPLDAIERAEKAGQELKTVVTDAHETLRDLRQVLREVQDANKQTKILYQNWYDRGKELAEGWDDRPRFEPHNDGLLWSFEHFFHMDKANACMHCAPVRFSPVTFRCLDDLLAHWPDDEDITQEMAEVKHHRGKYELDPGR